MQSVDIFSNRLRNDGSTKTTTKEELIDHRRKLLTAASSKEDGKILLESTNWLDYVELQT